MSIRLIVLVFCLVATSAIAQTKPREIDLTIDGVGPGSPLADTIAKFGVAPNKKIENEAARPSCGRPARTLLTMDYPGLHIVLDGDQYAQGFQIAAMTITSKKWTAAGAHIGDSPASTEKRFGKPNSTHVDGDATTYYYSTPEEIGTVEFEFTSGKLAKMSVAEKPC